LVLMFMFSAVGLIFLVIPDRVLQFFNTLSGWLGFIRAPLGAVSFYLVLAVGYMYLVSVLAWFMYRFPESRWFPLLLAHAKLASSGLSLVLFIAHRPFLIYMTNFIVDGAIGILALVFYRKIKGLNP